MTLKNICRVQMQPESNIYLWRRIVYKFQLISESHESMSPKDIHLKAIAVDVSCWTIEKKNLVLPEWQYSYSQIPKCSLGAICDII